jgi:hypothetical protein
MDVQQISFEIPIIYAKRKSSNGLARFLFSGKLRLVPRAQYEEVRWN